ncbi:MULTISPECIES: tail fiber assembly protein [Yersinia pseudotuberculosis complex]|uniref:Lambda tail fiber assembly protein G n=17 Tax=Yersinia pestis TaxID=632 RepID=A0A0H2W0D6_YERPE|nr:tail fiber assembly protein [Yersinia pestis]EDR31289.1 putative tail fiber assembly protein [Yersinia pestis biovar Orientalis str. IP275]EFA45737.1 caudovirales tail fibre assembly protein [Yersinia pestis KIM D27]ETO48856.1 tail assembly protein [Yersinia pestis S3]AAC82713.1 lambda tail fiber assembly protein G [Yersinia pestis KIM10+]AAS58638.1 phage lambda-related tail assembly protein G [Yersinia pestis biovar Microtus str. 91001]
MTFKMTDKARTLKVYNLLEGTNEYIGVGDAYIPPFTGLPANCTEIEPPTTTEGFAAVFDFTKQEWSLEEDHRGKTLYSTETGEPVFIAELGPLPENVTYISPNGEYQKWDGSAWVKDEEAEKTALVGEAEQNKSVLMKNVSQQISLLQDAIDLDMATDEEKETLVALKKYRVLLNRVDTSLAPDIDWPILGNEEEDSANLIK